MRFALPERPPYDRVGILAGALQDAIEGRYALVRGAERRSNV
jgi:hypothetical protein